MVRADCESPGEAEVNRLQRRSQTSWSQPELWVAREGGYGYPALGPKSEKAVDRPLVGP